MTAEHGLAPEQTRAAVAAAIRLVPPLWPLTGSVAVNPFLGQSMDDLAFASVRLARVAGERAVPERALQARRLASGEVNDSDLAAALAAHPELGDLDVAGLRAAAEQPRPAPEPLPTVAELAGEASGIDWPAVVTERIGVWAGGYFDEGQALWAAPRGRGAYAAWRAFATRDLTPEITGLRSFAAFVDAAPEHAEAALARSLHSLGAGAAALETLCHRALTSLGGWAQLGRWRLWQAELAGGSDNTLSDLLAVRLLWEEALFSQYRDRIAERWSEVLAAYAEPPRPARDDLIDTVLQEAAERAAQRRLGSVLTAAPAATPEHTRPELQAAFCIDVRSERFRRALEGVAPACETIGFAGFFGLPLAHRRFGSILEEARLPALLAPAVHSSPGVEEAAEGRARIVARARRAWGRFRLAAVSSFAFVEAAGPLYGYKLVRDSLAAVGRRPPREPQPVLADEATRQARIGLAAGILRGMSLTEGFAPMVLLVGHGANVVNNPHASALHCGACGGQSGEINARLVAALLNAPDVRGGLAGEGIEIPDDTCFVPGLHDTTTDQVTLYTEDLPAPLPAASRERLEAWLAEAGDRVRTERAGTLPRVERARHILRRARDWSEVRPEWGLAGCRAFVAAPRARTAGRALNGQVFLHDYDWRADERFGVLELLLTAPVVVASWISLQYYGSAVAPETFGAGSKLLHNVVGGIGVLEGNGGVLRAGLPWQSVHDGERLVHDPLRLTVVIEAPREAIADVLQRHPEVQALFDQRWLHLLVLDETGRLAWRYAGNRQWIPAATSADTDAAMAKGGPRPTSTAENADVARARRAP
ncbi:YbcC family protein [Sediminicurvatus halobius]|uniref:Probable inorganic carbon transporter subunit DabA n=1 Tax=Sediminicurvatus halobius TaxID=2182432 RepID=A0A2U2N3I8_9GAMM|nr:DUF2309 domain-containing protein [Spiribacter halobius]PWG63554.1 DUF2309 domain-containing protein [Spiribacter halobius]UEX79566.1 DUF2309 domain-containing protein [Spiribacter halobius]